MRHILLQLLVLLISSSAFAISVESWELEAGLEVPLQLGGRVKANFNSEFYKTAGAGMSLDFLMGINSSLVGGVGILGTSSAEVVESALSNSIVIDVRGGWNLHKYKGLYVEAGYLMMMGGGKEVTVDQLEGAFGTDYTNNPLHMSNQSIFSANSDLHALTAHAGYRWEINESWLINVDVGIIKPFLSSSTVDVDDVVRGSGSVNQAANAADDLKSKAEGELDDLYLSQLFIPTATVWITKTF